MSQAVLLQQVPFCGPGRIIPIFRDFGIPCEIRHLYKGDEVPTDLDEIRVLVVLSGPMRVADVGSPQHPYLLKEVELLRRMIEFDRPVLGIGLGAQLLAHAAGAKVYPNTPNGEHTGDRPVGEYGWAGVTFPFPGGTEPIVYGLMDGAPMFHWHSDTFDLPRLPPPANLPPGAPAPPGGSVLLSSTARCKNQAFRFKNRLFGFQFHFELTPREIEGWLENDRATLEQAAGPSAVEQIRRDTQQFYNRHARLGNRLIENFVQFLRAY
ncbi:MAG: hypothetical protein NZ561_05435 [Phycisphaerae bacterium]|nr:hypothetical protein [Phycisphaerae bacterium]MDW8263354.1 hypothetical protein [Phycisphaerales bacterium]